MEQNAHRNSIPAGDVVLAQLPPYGVQPWLSMGLVVLYDALARVGITSRVIRVLERLDDLPQGVVDASLATYLRDPPIHARLAAMEQAQDAAPGFFDQLLRGLLDGPEQVFALSLFRNNADLSLWVAKLLKQRRPSSFVILGGPETIEDPEPYSQPWVDVVVGTDAELTFLPVVESILENRLERLALIPNIWLNPALGVRSVAAEPKPPLRPAPQAQIDYAPLLALIAGDAPPTISVLLNWGCPYNCSFCTNRNIYSRFSEGSTERILAEIDQIVETWKQQQPDSPTLSIQFSDATTNVLSAQFDELLAALARRQKEWPLRPYFRGQILFDDSRIKDETVRLMTAANFGNAFFGLESASDELRRRLRKPAKIASVARAFEIFHRAGGSGLTYGVPIGIPGETNADWKTTVDFVDWTLSFKGALQGITVLPYMFFESAQDPQWKVLNVGERRGLLWRMNDPAGDAAERGRRLLATYERIDNRVETTSPFPPYLMLPMMLPDESPARLDAWMKKFGRIHDQLNDTHDQSRAAGCAPEAPIPALGGIARSMIEQSIQSGPHTRRMGHRRIPLESRPPAGCCRVCAPGVGGTVRAGSRPLLRRQTGVHAYCALQSHVSAVVARSKVHLRSRADDVLRERDPAARARPPRPRRLTSVRQLPPRPTRRTSAC